MAACSPGMDRSTRAAGPASTPVGGVIVAAAVAGLLSGLPSTAWALVRRQDVLASTRAASSLLPGRRRPSLLAGVAVHAAISLFWTAVFSRIPGRRHLGPVGGGVAGLVIAALDLGIFGRRHPAIQALSSGPQVADHIAFGAVAAAVLDRARARARPG